jgi:hypothetical protein
MLGALNLFRACLALLVFLTLNMGSLCAEPLYADCMDELASRAQNAKTVLDDETGTDGISRRIVIFSQNNEAMKDLNSYMIECLGQSFSKKISIRNDEYWGFASKNSNGIQSCEVPKDVVPWDGYDEHRGWPTVAVRCSAN